MPQDLATLMNAPKHATKYQPLQLQDSDTHLGARYEYTRLGPREIRLLKVFKDPKTECLLCDLEIHEITACAICDPLIGNQTEVINSSATCEM